MPCNSALARPYTFLNCYTLLIVLILLKYTIKLIIHSFQFHFVLLYLRCLTLKFTIMKLKVVLFILTIISNFVSKLLNDKDTNLSENAVKSLSIISALLSSVVESPRSLDNPASLASLDALSCHADKQLNMLYNA